MKPALIEKGIPAGVGAIGAALLVWWVLGYFRGPAISERPLGLDKPLNAPGAVSVGGAGLSFLNAGVAVAPMPGSWSGFRGDSRDGVSAENVALAREWAPSGPPLLWSLTLGEGYAGAAVRNGRVYVLDYDQASQADALRCFTLADGKEIWRRSYPAVVKRNHGMSRTVPATDGKVVVSLGPKCNVMCVDALTGAVKWQIGLVTEYGATVPEWYAGQCPLIDGPNVILATGGKALLIAVDLATGKAVWKSPNPRAWTMTHGSIATTTIGGEKMYVYCGNGGVAGISAKDGSILWDTTEWTINTATVPTPVPIGDGRVFLSGGYDSGAMMVQIDKSGGKWSCRSLYRLAPTVFGSDQQTPIFYRGYIYGVIPGGQLVCLDLNGKQVWASGKMHRFGLGPYTIADGLVYMMNDTGTMTVVEASSAGYKQVAEAKLMDGQDAWGPIAIAGGRLIARDLTRMVCLDVSRK